MQPDGRQKLWLKFFLKAPLWRDCLLIRSVDHKSLEFYEQVSGYAQRVTGYAFRVAGYAFRVTGYAFRVTGYAFRVAGYAFRVTDRFSSFWDSHRPRSRPCPRHRI